MPARGVRGRAGNTQYALLVRRESATATATNSSQKGADRRNTVQRGLETAVVLVTAFVVLPLTALVSVSSNVPTPLWLALLLACVSYAPARAWSVRR